MFIPPLNKYIITRQRLLDKIFNVEDIKLTLVVAPAGFGKTTLVCEWLHKNEQTKSIWLSLDENDNDESKFLSYFISLFQQLDKNIGHNIQEALQLPELPDPGTILIPFINNIITFGENFTVILDDYHVISNTYIHTLISILIENMPANMHLIILTRKVPSFNLARLRSRRLISEIKASDLRFDFSEISYFYNHFTDLTLSDEIIQKINIKTEGWITGIQLATIKMEQLEIHEYQDFINNLTGSNEYVLDFLIEEVLEKQPDYIKKFLFITSIFDRFNILLCDYIFNKYSPDLNIDSKKIVEYLYNNNLFLVQLDNNRNWFRYHHLFITFLRNQCNTIYPDLKKDIYLIASDWFESHDMRSEAISYSLMAKDYQKASDLIYNTCSSMMSKGEFYSSLTTYYDTLPIEIIKLQPQLGIWYAWALLLNYKRDKAITLLNFIEKKDYDHLTDDQKLQMTIIKALLAKLEGKFDESLSLSKNVLLKIDNIENHPQVYMGTHFYLADVYLYKGDFENSFFYYNRIFQFSCMKQSLTPSLAALWGMIRIELLIGDLKKVKSLLNEGREIIEEAKENNIIIPAASYIYTGFSLLHIEQNNIESANFNVNKLIELSKKWKIPVIHYDGLISKAYLAIINNEDEESKTCQDKANKIIFPGIEYETVYGSFEYAEMYLLILEIYKSSNKWNEKNRIRIESYFKNQNISITSNLDSIYKEMDYVLYIKFLILNEKFEMAHKYLNYIETLNADKKRIRLLLHIKILQALTWYVMNKNDNAFKSLKKALSIAKPHKYIAPFIDMGIKMKELLKLLLKQEHTNTYLKTIITSFPDDEAYMNKKHDMYVVTEPLSERELEVLKNLDTKLSGPEIAHKLYISTNTLKTHIKNIYSKLNVHSRHDAVEIGKEQDLI